MKAFSIFYLKQTVLLGSIGFAIFQSIAWVQLGWFWASDILDAWLFSLAIVAIYLLVIASPILWVASKLESNYWAVLLSCFTGFVTVLGYMVFFSNRQPSVYNFIIWPWNMYLIFGVVGLLYGLSYVRNTKA